MGKPISMSFSSPRGLRNLSNASIEDGEGRADQKAPPLGQKV